MGNEYEMFKQFLLKQNLKFTPQRKSILDAVFATHHHFDADQMVLILKERGNEISRASVYRTLDLLIKSGLVNALELGNSKKTYEHVVGHKHHDHLICVECGRTIEFDDSFIEMLQEKVCDRLKFLAEHHSLRIFGKCERCR
ncbi:MAG: transcriptional repressor [Candidatus Abyssobacteria bacterium SURF_5]|uniref:Ferric uptake regulation protein n=1 Tax=Abyssobacteria bacterium (strain SURF_5) TaxID=2093360 RepID=A0A3A4NJA2_ABYX5|nr:MAG: transcriptional repressor [Candidatus Abyssubacteria bacterium SURF_5]